jgi:hypothetical protein
MSLADDLARLEKNSPPPDQAGAAWRSSLTSEHADIETAPVADKITDWTGVLRHFGLDPAEFEIIDDTVKMSSWQQSRRTDDGDRDLVWMYAYKARFRRVTTRLPEADVDALTAKIDRWKPTKPAARKAGLGAPCTLHVGWSDWQLGKSGVAVTTQRVLDSFDRTVARVAELRRMGRNVTSVAIANMGDPIEGCYGNYESQLFTVEMTKREQLNHALDLWTTGIRALAPLFDDVLFVSVLSNHSEWTRQGTGGRPVTSDSDSADGFLAETLQRVLADRPTFEHVRWLIPHDEMTVCERLSGVDVAYTHGHKMPGSPKELDWLRGQSIRLLREHGAEPRLWNTAHRHHVDVKDFGPWWRMQHPTLDNGSKWFEDSSGMWSTPGTMTYLIGEHDQAGGPLAAGGKGWSDMAVL